MSEAAPVFPPLFRGHAVAAETDPFAKACVEAALGCDPGLIAYMAGSNRVAAAAVLAPEVPLAAAMAMLPACGLGFQNALGALAPPEVAVHLTWDGGILINGAGCGRLQVAAAATEPAALADWLVVGFGLPLVPTDPDRPGDRPHETTLYEEGCVEVSPGALVESWSRHFLVWINRWMEDGARPLHAEWRGLAHDIGEPVRLERRRPPLSGIFLGIDENFGMLLRDGAETRLLPLTELVDRTLWP